MKIEHKKSIRDKWIESGLLEGLSRKEQMDLAMLLEDIAICVLNNPIYHGEFETFMFPCCRRTFTHGGIKKINTKHYVESLYQFCLNYDDVCQFIIQYIPNADLDADLEAELCVFFAEYFYPLCAIGTNIKRVVLIEKKNQHLRSYCNSKLKNK